MSQATTAPSGARESIGSWYRRQVVPRLTAELVFAGVTLRGSGRERRAACPLHGGDNKTALAINVHDLRWHCLTGCAGGGDALDWIAASHGLARPGESPRGPAFIEAVRLAAALVGVTPPDAPLSPAEQVAMEREAAQRLAEASAARERAAAAEEAEAASKTAVARALWAAAEANSPILARYLEGRRCWPPPGAAEQATLPRLPGRVRYATRQAIAEATAPLTRTGEGWRLPPAAAGAVLYAYAPPSRRELVALQLDALTPEGQRLRDRWRRGIGSRRGGAAFGVRGRADARGWTAICEGEVTALAIAAASPDVSEVRGVGGTEGLL